MNSAVNEKVQEIVELINENINNNYCYINADEILDNDLIALYQGVVARLMGAVILNNNEPNKFTYMGKLIIIEPSFTYRRYGFDGIYNINIYSSDNNI